MIAAHDVDRALLLMEARLIEAEQAASFAWWIKRARTDLTWGAKHFRVMQDVLDRVTSGEKRRVAFSVPIRHGKSEHNTISYSAYRLERDARTRILLASYATVRRSSSPGRSAGWFVAAAWRWTVTPWRTGKPNRAAVCVPSVRAPAWRRSTRT